MNVCLLALWGDSLTFTLAHALAHNGHAVEVRIADRERHSRAAWGSPQRIAAIAGVRVEVDSDAAPAPCDHLLVQGHPLLTRHPRLLERLTAAAQHVTLITSGDRSRPRRSALALQWREMRALGRRLARVRQVAYKDGFYAMDLFAPLRPRRVVGFDPHAKFLLNPSLFAALHARDWDPDAERPLRANFLGSRDPAARDRILGSIEGYFTGPLALPRMLWHAYTDAQPAALGQLEFVNALTDSDFTLAPPGYSLVTHRPVEALLRGSIPVLHADELDLYDLGLVDGVNCIAVPSGQWPQAMERIAALPAAEVRRMRRRIRDEFLDEVGYARLSRRICARLGVGDASGAGSRG